MATRSHNIKTQQVSTYLPTPKQERVPPARSGLRTSVVPGRDGKASSAGRGPKRGRATTNQNCKFLLRLTSDYFSLARAPPHSTTTPALSTRRSDRTRRRRANTVASRCHRRRTSTAAKGRPASVAMTLGATQLTCSGAPLSSLTLARSNRATQSRQLRKQ